MSEEEQILGRGKCECLKGDEKSHILEGLDMLLQKTTDKLEKENRNAYIKVLTIMKSTIGKTIKKVENTPNCRY